MAIDSGAISSIAQVAEENVLKISRIFFGKLLVIHQTCQYFANKVFIHNMHSYIFIIHHELNALCGLKNICA